MVESHMRSNQLKPYANITYANAFDANLSLLLRERRSTTLLSMQEAIIEVESNILESERLKTRSNKDKKKRQPKKKYNLRKRGGAPKATTYDQNKKVEVIPKPNPRKDMSSKSHQLPPPKPAVPEIKEVDRPPTSFNLEHELRKINILVPLIELMKNEPFKKSIMKFLQPTPSIVSSDVISL
jgi:hypothetical protein